MSGRRPAKVEDRCVRAWMLLAQAQRMPFCLFAEITEGLLAKEIHRKYEERCTEGGCADGIGMDSFDSMGVRAVTAGTA